MAVKNDSRYSGAGIDSSSPSSLFADALAPAVVVAAAAAADVDFAHGDGAS